MIRRHMIATLALSLPLVAAPIAHAQVPGVGAQAQGSVSSQGIGGSLGGNAAGTGIGAGGNASGSGMLGGMGNMGGMGKMVGGMTGMGGMGLPGLGNASSSNIAGVLSYCVQNNAVASSAGNSVLSKLTGQGNVAGSSGFQAGQQGLLQTAAGGNASANSGGTFSLSNLAAPLKQRLCRAVLSRAQNLL